MVLRIGLDLAWYVRNGFGSLHGLNANLDPAGLYDYLTHQYRISGGAKGGFFTCYAYEIHNIPLNPPGYYPDRSWIINFIQAANADGGGQKAKVVLKFILENNFDSSMVGGMWDFFEHLGTADKNPSVQLVGFRGAQEGIYEGGGACCGGCEGTSFIPAIQAYGPTGMASYPQNTTDLTQKWSVLQQIANAYGYKLGVSTGLSNIDNVSCLGTKNYVDNLAQWFIQGSQCAPFVKPAPDNSYTQNYNAFYQAINIPSTTGVFRAATVSKGLVFGEWDPHWFIPNTTYLNYGINQYGLQSALQGAADGYKALNLTDDRFWMIYGMPYLTNDDQTYVNQYGLCPYMSWLYQYATQYGFFTDFSPVPAPVVVPPVAPPVIPAQVPTGSFITVHGDSSLPKPGWSQTNPVYCCGADTFTLGGALTRVDNGAYIGGKTVKVKMWDFSTCQWVVIATATTSATAVPNPYGYAINWGLLTMKSPALPGTQRNQAYFYSEFDGDSGFMGSNGVLEDLPVLPATVQTALSITVKQL